MRAALVFAFFVREFTAEGVSCFMHDFEDEREAFQAVCERDFLGRSALVFTTTDFFTYRRFFLRKVKLANGFNTFTDTSSALNTFFLNSMIHILKKQRKSIKRKNLIRYAMSVTRIDNSCQHGSTLYIMELLCLVQVPDEITPPSHQL